MQNATTHRVKLLRGYGMSITLKDNQIVLKNGNSSNIPTNSFIANDNGFKELQARIFVNIKKVGNVILAVKDIDKSLQFYHETIGLPIKNQRRSWVDLGTTGAILSLHPASLTAQHIGSSIENGITIGFLVGDVKSAVEELRAKGVTIYRDIVEKDAGKNAVILDPDDYLISLFEPIFDDKAQQTGGYQGFTPA